MSEERVRELIQREFKPTYWSVFEREPRMNALPDQIIFGQYKSEQEALEAKTKYFGDDDNYYVKSHTHPRKA